MKHLFNGIAVILLSVWFSVEAILKLIWSFNVDEMWDEFSVRTDYYQRNSIMPTFYKFSDNVLSVKFKNHLHFIWGMEPIEIIYRDKVKVKKTETVADMLRKRYFKKADEYLSEKSLITKEFISYEPDILKSIKREIAKMDDIEEWDRIFLMFDLHGTVIKPNRIIGNTEIEYYPYAKETLQLISNRSDLDLNIYTCSHEHEVKSYQDKFKADGIIFKYVNENPDVESSGYGNYEKKPYMNVLFEDKAGFFGEDSWLPVYEYFKNRYK